MSRNHGPVRTLLVVAALLVGTASAFGEDGSGATSEFERVATMTAEEQLGYVDAANTEIRDGEKQIARLLEQARKDTNVESIQCLVNRLTSVRALLQVSSDAATAMANAIAAGDTVKANHEVRKSAVAVSKTRQFVGEAQSCALEQRLDSGSTFVDWTTLLGDDDGLADITTTGTNLEPPPVSPFL